MIEVKCFAFFTLLVYCFKLLHLSMRRKIIESIRRTIVSDIFAQLSY